MTQTTLDNVQIAQSYCKQSQNPRIHRFGRRILFYILVQVKTITRSIGSIGNGKPVASRVAFFMMRATLVDGSSSGLDFFAC